MSTSCSTTLNNTDPLKQVQDLKTLRMDYNKYFKQAVPEEYEFDDDWIEKQVCLKKHRLLYAKYYGKNDVAWMRSKIIKAKKERDAPRPRITTDKDLPGWTIRSTIRKHGKLAGKNYKMYYSPSGRCYRSRVQALRVLQAKQDHAEALRVLQAEQDHAEALRVLQAKQDHAEALRVLQAKQDHAEALVDNADEGRNTRKRKHSDMMQDTRTSEHMEDSDESAESSDEEGSVDSGESKDCCDEDVEDPDETLTDIDVPEDDTENNNGAPMDQMPMTYEEMQRKLHMKYQEVKGNYRDLKYGDFIFAECLKHRRDILKKLTVVQATQLLLTTNVDPLTMVKAVQSLLSTGDPIDLSPHIVDRVKPEYVNLINNLVIKAIGLARAAEKAAQTE